MKRLITKLAVMAVFCLTASAFAQSPLAGTWKFNQGKSKITGDTMSFAPAPGDAVKFSAAGMSYIAKLDGSDSTTPMGFTTEWTKIDESTWKVVAKKGTTLLSTDTMKLSPDDKTLEYTSEGTKPNGDSFHDTSTYARIAGTKAFSVHGAAPKPARVHQPAMKSKITAMALSPGPYPI